MGLSMTSKWKSNYFLVKGVEFGSGELSVVFRNEDRVALSLDRIAPDDHSEYRWKNARVADSGLYVFVPGKKEDLEIPGDFIRRLTDAAYARHAAELAEEQAKLIGRRLRELREKRGLSQVELARRAGIQQANLSRIENAQFDVATSTLWKLLAVMGYGPGDLTIRSEVRAAARSHGR